MDLLYCPHQLPTQRVGGIYLYILSHLTLRMVPLIMIVCALYIDPRIDSLPY